MKSSARWLHCLLVVALSAAMTATIADTADWGFDAQPAVSALAEGRVGNYLHTEALMGPVSTLVQAPFVWASPGGELTDYRWAAFPCLLVCGLVGVYLAAIAGRRGLSPLARTAFVVIAVVNPLSVEALRNGHPEEILTAGLAVAAIASAAEGRRGWAALLLGLAIASKQWAVIAALPALMALPGGRLRVALGAGVVVAALFLPTLIASPSTFLDVHSTAASTGQVVTPWSAWYPFAEVDEHTYRVGGETLVAHPQRLSDLVGSLAHPLVIALALIVPLLLAARRRSLWLSGGEAMALFAALVLLRCVLDPVDNLYYHLPLLLALLGWDAFTARRLPLRALAAFALVTLAWDRSQSIVDPAAFNLVYLAVALPVLVLILRSLWLSKPAPGRLFGSGQPAESAFTNFA